MLAVARTFSLAGIVAEPVHVEVDVSSGLPSFAVVGLPDAAVRESRERVRAALSNAGFDFPMRRITANLAPADLPKAGPGFDLAIAAGLLVAANQLPAGVLARYAFAGELALDGSIRPVPGALAMAEGARALGIRGIAVAPGDAEQARLVEGVEVVALEHLSSLPRLAEGTLKPLAPRAAPPPPEGDEGPDLSDLRGQPALRRAIEIAAAGGHSMLVVGPPGSGKTLAARRLPSLLPPLPAAQVLEVMRIAGVCGNGGPPSPERPFRAPHHTASARALIGGGRPPRPGEITRAHRGVLFLDELGEFRRDALEALRQPLEDGEITLPRARDGLALPCSFILVAAANPCPCGRGEDSGKCNCAPAAIARHKAKLSGALADRIDISLGISRPSADDLSGDPGESSVAVRARVAAARRRQEERLGEGRCNASMTPAETRRRCRLGREEERTLSQWHERLGMSGRGWDRVLRVARTIADAAGCERIEGTHLEQALSLRRKDD